MTCPICARETAQKYRPFCSRRCADVDLARWMNGAYAVPSQDPADMDAASEAVLEAENTPPKPH